MNLEIVIDKRLKKIKNELAKGNRKWKRLNIEMNKLKIKYPTYKDWDYGDWHNPYEDRREYMDAQREVYNIIDIEIKLKEEKRYLHDLVRKSKK